jgi:hypothetical protein
MKAGSELKASRYNKLLGMAVGEKSLFVAEVTAGEKPDVKRLAEFIYPAESSLADPATLGISLGTFLRDQRFTARQAVVGLPAKWLLVKTKEVPPADSSVAADLLRLQAEGDFSSELKDLVFDYAGEASPSGSRNVLLVATPQKYIDLVHQMCESAKVEPIAVTSSSAALGTITGRANGENAVVLTLAAAGSELTAQSGGYTSTLRHLRASVPEPLFLSELRRAVSMLPAGGSNGGRELIVWDGGGVPTGTLGESLGMRVRTGDLPSLGVSTTEAARNGGGRKFASAVALALAVLGDSRLPIDFLHSRLAAPAKRLVARWMIWTAIGVVAFIGVTVLAYSHLQKAQANLDGMAAEYKQKEPSIKAADAFVTKVSFAQRWHGGDPRYLACMNEITRLVPEDGQTYCTSLIIREKEVTKAETKKDSLNKAANETRQLVITFNAKAPNQAAALQLKDAFQKEPNHRFIDMNFKGTQNTGKAGEVTFSFSCTYVPVARPVP